MIGNNLQEALPGFEMPELYNSNNYVRTGRQSSSARKRMSTISYFLKNTEMIWNHHMFEAYHIPSERQQ